MVTPDKARYIAELLGSFTDGSTIDKAIVHLNDLATQVERLEAQRKLLREALRVVALIPVEEFGKENKPDYQLMGWNDYRLYVSDVLAARAALKETE